MVLAAIFVETASHRTIPWIGKIETLSLRCQLSTPINRIWSLLSCYLTLGRSLVS